LLDNFDKETSVNNFGNLLPFQHHSCIAGICRKFGFIHLPQSQNNCIEFVYIL
jgi:hypothetical protein